MTPKYLTTEEVAAKLGLAVQTIQKYCLEERFKGAFKAGAGHRAPYLIPESAVKNFQQPKRGRPATKPAKPTKQQRTKEPTR